MRYFYSILYTMNIYIVVVYHSVFTKLTAFSYFKNKKYYIEYIEFYIEMYILEVADVT